LSESEYAKMREELERYQMRVEELESKAAVAE
jgi:hypothetical protein